MEDAQAQSVVNPQQAIAHYLQRVPKAELHIHLEGSISPTTLLTLAERNKVRLPISNLQELREWFRFRNFPHFVEIFSTISGCLRTIEDYELITYEFGAEMSRQNVRYAEITFSPSTHRFTRGLDHDIYFRGLTQGRKRAYHDFGVEMRWVFDIVRDVSDEEDRRLRAEYTTKVAIELMQEGVIGLGLGGHELGNPPELFASWFERGLAAGLHSVPHAGEGDGPTSVWGALVALQAERIGHGVRAIEDQQLVNHLATHRVPLEVCPLSNTCLGIYPSLAVHPLPTLYASGVPISVNSDDPPLFNATLNQNVGSLHDAFQLSLGTIDEILLNGVRHSFLPQERKEQMLQSFQEEMVKLRQEYNLTNNS